MAEGNQKKIVQAVIFVVTFAAAYFGTQYAMSSFKSDNALKKLSIEMNKKCPQTIDAETRMDSTNVFDNTLQYNYTLVNVVKDSTVVNFETVKKSIQANAQKNLDTNPKMKEFREKDVSLKYHYNDKNKKFLFDLTIKPNRNAGAAK